MKIGQNKFDERAGSDLPISQQAALLWISRSSLSYVPHPPSLREVAVKHRMAVLFTDDPCLGSATAFALAGPSRLPD